MSHAPMRGACLCGTVSFLLDPPIQRMVHCHCSRCRRSSGAAHSTNLAVAPAQLRWLPGTEAIVRFDLPDAARFGKWFCRHCGCPVPRLMPDGSVYVVPAGALAVEPPAVPAEHLFLDSRARWSCHPGTLPVQAVAISSPIRARLPAKSTRTPA